MKAVFLDRDGTINEDSPAFIKSWSEFRFLPRAKKALSLLSNSGFKIIIVTDQSGIGRGLLSLEDLSDIHRKMTAEIEAAGGRIDGIFFCGHHPNDGCSCRKPKTGMFQQASQAHAIDLSKSYMIGDKPADIEAGKRAGCRAILVKTGLDASYQGLEPDFVAEDILEAANIIIKDSSSNGI